MSEPISNVNSLQRPTQSRLSFFLSSIFAISVLLFAFVGNARIFGLDVVLAAIAPVCILLFVISNPKFSERGILIGTLASFFAYVAVLLALRFDMLLGHVFWPIKALLLAFFLNYSAPRVHAAQIHLLALLVGIFILTSTDQFGRSYGFFGPNMLYRFYGLLFLAALYMVAIQRRHWSVWSAYIVAALFGVIQTGSVGGILLIAVGVSAFVRVSLRSLAAITVLGVMTVINWQRIQDIFIVQRLLLKLNFENLESSSRIEGAQQILAEGVTPFGHSYETFHHVWRAGFDYPHNIFVELVSFYGFMGIVVSVFLVCALIIVWRRIYSRDCGLFDLAYVALFVGTLLSGDLSDNYGAVGLAISIVKFSANQKKSNLIRIRIAKA